VFVLMRAFFFGAHEPKCVVVSKLYFEKEDGSVWHFFQRGPFNKGAPGL